MKFILTLLFIIVMQVVFIPLPRVYAATTPTLGEAASFGILSSTYTNTVGGTTINGDLGYTVGPAFNPTVNGTTYTPPSTKYSTAGTDQASALAALASQPCTHTFPAGAVDLATDISHGPIGVYTPGVYCTTAASAASIGAAGITLSGSGTFIFRIDGALTTVANSVVSATGGASACDIFWTPTGATTLGANSTFVGTDIDAAGVTIGNSVALNGRILVFGGTVSTAGDTITVPTCTSGQSTPTPSSNSSSPSNSNSSSTTTTSSSLSSSSTGGSNSCPTLNNVSPVVIESERIDTDSISLKWGPYSGIDTFTIQYGVENGKWLYSANVTGFSTILNDLPKNKTIWVRIAATNNCSVGNYGEAKLVGAPGVPNAGVAPRENILTFLWHGISALPSLILSFVTK